MPKAKLTLLKAIEIGKRIEAVCHKVDGAAVYDDGYSDGKLARELGVSYHNVRLLRLQLVGEIGHYHNGHDDHDLAHRVEQLEKTVSLLMVWAQSRENDPLE